MYTLGSRIGRAWSLSIGTVSATCPVKWRSTRTPRRHCERSEAIQPSRSGPRRPGVGAGRTAERRADGRLRTGSVRIVERLRPAEGLDCFASLAMTGRRNVDDCRPGRHRLSATQTALRRLLRIRPRRAARHRPLRQARLDNRQSVRRIRPRRECRGARVEARRDPAEPAEERAQAAQPTPPRDGARRRLHGLHPRPRRDRPHPRQFRGSRADPQRRSGRGAGKRRRAQNGDRPRHRLGEPGSERLLPRLAGLVRRRALHKARRPRWLRQRPAAPVRRTQGEPQGDG